MPTLPLYTPADVPNASHRVIAPGGYETWHFDAESTSGDVRLAAVLGVGWPLDSSYLRRYLRYRRRPTRRPPPVPAECPFAHFAAYEGARLLAEFTASADPAEFAASPHEPAVRVGGNELVREPDGALSVRLRGLASRSAATGSGGGCLSAQLVFRPLLPHPPFETALLGPQVSSDLHRWVIAAPSCQVSGSVTLSPDGGDGSRAGAREIDFRGRGSHDHRYGTGPLGATLRRWASGHAFLGDTAYAFHVARPLDRGLDDDVRVVRCDDGGVRPISEVPSHVDWRAGQARQSYPNELDCGGRLCLVRPRVIDAAGGRVRLQYLASDDGGRSGTAWCEVASPRGSASVFGKSVATGR